MKPAASGAAADRESDDEPPLSRVTVVVGRLRIDLGLPAGVRASSLAGAIIDIANDQFVADAGVRIDDTDGRWTLARPLGDPLGPEMTLSEAGVHDGDVLVIAEVGAAQPAVLLESVADAVNCDRNRWFARMWFSVGLVFAVTSTPMLLAHPRAPSVAGVPIGAAIVLALGIACAAAAFISHWRSAGSAMSAAASARLTMLSMPLIFGGALCILPEAPGVQALPMALALTALVAVLQLLVSDSGRASCTAVVAVALLAVPPLLAQWIWDVDAAAVGAVTATAAVAVVYLAPSATIAVSRLPVPRVPTAGEPLDDVEIQGVPAVEGVNAITRVVPTGEHLGERVRRAGEQLTGITVAAVGVAIAGCFLAADVSEGFYWQGVVFGLVVATALCLRGRRHHVLAQAATLIGGGLVTALTVIVKTTVGAPAWQVGGVIALTALCVLVLVCGLVAPALEFSPVAQRWAEIGEYVAGGLIVPLACWILGIYAYFRELHI